jgi:hypothetical protein
MAGGKDGERLSVVRVDGDCLLEQRLRGDIVLAGHPPEVRQRPHYEVPGVEAIMPQAARGKRQYRK